MYFAWFNLKRSVHPSSFWWCIRERQSWDEIQAVSPLTVSLNEFYKFSYIPHWLKRNSDTSVLRLVGRVREIIWTVPSTWKAGSKCQFYLLSSLLIWGTLLGRGKVQNLQMREDPDVGLVSLPWFPPLGKLQNTSATFLQPYFSSALSHFSHLKLLKENHSICLYLCLFFQTISCEMQSFNNRKMIIWWITEQ